MTAIVGISWDGAALIAGDGAGSDSAITWRERTPKIAKRDGYLVGAAGDAGACMTALHGLDVRYEGGGLLLWAHRVYLPALRVALTQAANDDEPASCTVLLAAAGELVLADTASGGCTDFGDGYHAIGCGGPVALGALAVTRRTAPIARARMALRAASRHVDGVSRPWSYVASDGSAGWL